tara:strand:+ start:196 stop:447 length:252 start_codon:yes stop_codon:yes gene_type:complete
MRKRKSKGIAFSDFTDLIKDMQNVLKEENKIRVEMSEDDDWDLVKEITITPSLLKIVTSYTTMEFEEGDMTRAKIRRNIEDEY